MGVHSTPQMADAFGVPTFYVTDIVQEDAGNGNVRVFLCTKRAGVLSPQCEVIMSAATLLILSKESTAFAEDLFNARKLVAATAH